MFNTFGYNSGSKVSPRIPNSQLTRMQNQQSMMNIYTKMPSSLTINAKPFLKTKTSGQIATLKSAQLSIKPIRF